MNEAIVRSLQCTNIQTNYYMDFTLNSRLRLSLSRIVPIVNSLTYCVNPIPVIVSMRVLLIIPELCTSVSLSQYHNQIH